MSVNVKVTGGLNPTGSASVPRSGLVLVFPCSLPSGGPGKTSGVSSKELLAPSEAKPDLHG